MSEMDAVDPASAEQSRVESETLPLVIQTVGGLSAAVGVISIVLALTGIVPWLLGSGVSALLAAPFLYGFADIVLSLRKLCSKR
ncbi:hypothetical protein I5U67_03265 [Stenotrophomonas maltophilia]|jgi:hypothetical protein|uniref:Transmembrane protein n=1 Tax=Stenotrophomonas maltophilia TaxID=40324 RepID=A0A6B8J611_STEMA|nr:MULTISPECIES: hypothetical protein [Stenotrophomonas]ELC7322131.1 hypothetical protein [Stenotrophomonas maltophilia]MBA0276028.1 hypothetical protein [Stenotrophomonas maltophilia]MBA0411228.1 hypothetical protein [Stenotrophomonas maltophilia]MBA0496329.1 hypothetical protein [Stenotrophomonas maltophilia]MBA0505764.1 hypothetical protein [Stenotrophomonas maltophilia]